MRLLYGERRREGVEMFVQVTYDKAADPGRLRAAFDPEGAGAGAASSPPGPHR
jgi:hypothetical protein